VSRHSSPCRALALSARARARERAAADLPLRHRDRFERLLIARARAGRLTIVTAERRYAGYGVRPLDAAA
jgi:PIN domain nuclease of toxin-antitoxin system